MQIKFRGKNNHGDWSYGGVTPDKKYIVDKLVFRTVQPETVGQFTGHCDKNGKEIYEGDIVTEYEKMPYIVKWIDRLGGFYFKNNEIAQTMANSDIVQIVGNIHDEPRLFGVLQYRIDNGLD